MKNLNPGFLLLVVLMVSGWGPVRAQEVVAVRNTKIRTEPARNGQVVERVPKGTILHLLPDSTSSNNYFHVQCITVENTGWVVKSAAVEVLEDTGLENTDYSPVYPDIFGTGQIPPGYYARTDGLTGDSLKDVLHSIIRNHRPCSYEEVYSFLEKTDSDPYDSTRVILLYTGRSELSSQKDHGGRFDYEANGYSYQDAWNREHVWPKSHGFPDEHDTAYTDLHHIRPADRTVNSERNTRSFDEGDSLYYDNQGTVRTECRKGTDWVWEPPDFVKGDIARMLFYMDVRYEGHLENGILSGDLELVDENLPIENRDPRLGKLSTLLRWHGEDPVDNWERRRNDIIYRRYQGNRNPFIDHPEFVRLVWGEP